MRAGVQIGIGVGIGFGIVALALWFGVNNPMGCAIMAICIALLAIVISLASAV